MRLEAHTIRDMVFSSSFHQVQDADSCAPHRGRAQGAQVGEDVIPSRKYAASPVRTSPDSFLKPPNTILEPGLRLSKDRHLFRERVPACKDHICVIEVVALAVQAQTAAVDAEARPLIEAADSLIGTKDVRQLLPICGEDLVLALVCHLKLRVVLRAHVGELEAVRLKFSDQFEKGLSGVQVKVHLGDQALHPATLEQLHCALKRLDGGIRL